MGTAPTPPEGQRVKGGHLNSFLVGLFLLPLTANLANFLLDRLSCLGSYWEPAALRACQTQAWPITGLREDALLVQLRLALSFLLHVGRIYMAPESILQKMLSTLNFHFRHALLRFAHYTPSTTVIFVFPCVNTSVKVCASLHTCFSYVVV